MLTTFASMTCFSSFLFFVYVISFIFIQIIACSDISDTIHNDIRYSFIYTYYTHAVPLQSAGYRPC